MKPVHPGKVYGRIGHLVGSRAGPGDVVSPSGLARLCTEGPLREGARLHVLEKLDGSCVAAWRQGDRVLALGRQGDLAALSPNEGRRLWAAWVAEHEALLRELLADGERLVGEWLTLVHGVRYALPHGPFVALDVMRGGERLPYEALRARVAGAVPVAGRVATAPIAPEAALERLGAGFHGAIDPPEGLVYRLERPGTIALAKFVRASHRAGARLPEATGGAALWNRWRGGPPAPDAGAFEAHVTVAADVDRAAFAAACARRGLRCVDIELARGERASQPMTASVHRGALGDVLDELRGLAAGLADEGFPVARVKVEALGDHPLAPRTDAEAAAAPDRYFEFHLKLLIPEEADTAALVALVAPHGAHLSRNARARVAGGEHRFLTLRAYGVGRAAAEARFRALVLAVQDAGWQPVARIQEYTVYDSHAALDRGWLPA